MKKFPLVIMQGKKSFQKRGTETYGVDLLETSLVIYSKEKKSQVSAKSFQILRIWIWGTRGTHNVNTLISGNTNLGALGTEIDTDDTHGQRFSRRKRKGE